MQRTRVKICGVTRPQDAQAAVTAGADAIGVILHAESPRLIDIESAKLIRRAVPPFVSLVGVFVDASADQLRDWYHAIGLDILQLHGSESGEFAAELGLPYIRAIRAKSKQHVESEIASHVAAQGLLLDPYVEGLHGGTGKVLQPALWPSSAPRPLILAGGIGPNNIASAVNKLKPYAVDLNSAVEDSPGVKSKRKINAAFSELSTV